MSPLAKVFVVLITIVAIGVFGVSATLYNTAMNWKETARKATEASTAVTKAYEDKFAAQAQQMAQMSRQGQADAIRARTNEGRNALLEQQIERERNLASDKDKDIGDMKTELVDVKAARDRLTEDFNSATARVDSARQDAQAAKDAKALAEQRLARSMTDNLDLQAERDQMQIELVSAKESRDDAKLAMNKIIAYGIPVAEILGGMPAKDIDGTIVDVSAEDGLAVLSVGGNQGVEVGNKFTIYEGDAFIGTVEVIRVDPSMSGAKIKLLKDGQRMSIGNRASTRLSY